MTTPAPDRNAMRLLARDLCLRHAALARLTERLDDKLVRRLNGEALGLSLCDSWTPIASPSSRPVAEDPERGHPLAHLTRRLDLPGVLDITVRTGRHAWHLRTRTN